MRGGEDGTSRRRQSVRESGVETDQPVRMPGAEQHRGTVPRGFREPLREGVERRESPLGVDHIGPGRMPWIARYATPVRHQSDQIMLLPSPFGIESDRHSWIPSGEQPITPETHFTRGGHSPGQPRRQQMRPQRSGTQHAPMLPHMGRPRPHIKGNTHSRRSPRALLQPVRRLRTRPFRPIRGSGGGAPRFGNGNGKRRRGRKQPVARHPQAAGGAPTPTTPAAGTPPAARPTPPGPTGPRGRTPPPTPPTPRATAHRSSARAPTAAYGRTRPAASSQE